METSSSRNVMQPRHCSAKSGQPHPMHASRTQLIHSNSIANNINSRAADHGMVSDDGGLEISAHGSQLKLFTRNPSRGNFDSKMPSSNGTPSNLKSSKQRDSKLSSDPAASHQYLGRIAVQQPMQSTETKNTFLGMTHDQTGDQYTNSHHQDFADTTARYQHQLEREGNQILGQFHEFEQGRNQLNNLQGHGDLFGDEGTINGTFGIAMKEQLLNNQDFPQQPQPQPKPQTQGTSPKQVKKSKHNHIASSGKHLYRAGVQSATISRRKTQHTNNQAWIAAQSGAMLQGGFDLGAAFKEVEELTSEGETKFRPIVPKSFQVEDAASSSNNPLSSNRTSFSGRIGGPISYQLQQTIPSSGAIFQDSNNVKMSTSKYSDMNKLPSRRILSPKSKAVAEGKTVSTKKPQTAQYRRQEMAIGQKASPRGGSKNLLSVTKMQFPNFRPSAGGVSKRSFNKIRGATPTSMTGPPVFKPSQQVSNSPFIALQRSDQKSKALQQKQLKQEDFRLNNSSASILSPKKKKASKSISNSFGPSSAKPLLLKRGQQRLNNHESENQNYLRKNTQDFTLRKEEKSIPTTTHTSIVIHSSSGPQIPGRISTQEEGARDTQQRDSIIEKHPNEEHYSRKSTTKIALMIEQRFSPSEALTKSLTNQQQLQQHQQQSIIVPAVVDLNRMTEDLMPPRSTSQMEQMVNLGCSYKISSEPFNNDPNTLAKKLHKWSSSQGLDQQQPVNGHAHSTHKRNNSSELGTSKRNLMRGMTNISPKMSQDLQQDKQSKRSDKGMPAVDSAAYALGSDTKEVTGDANLNELQNGTESDALLQQQITKIKQASSFKRTASANYQNLPLASEISLKLTQMEMVKGGRSCGNGLSKNRNARGGSSYQLTGHTGNLKQNVLVAASLLPAEKILQRQSMPVNDIQGGQNNNTQNSASQSNLNSQQFRNLTQVQSASFSGNNDSVHHNATQSYVHQQLTTSAKQLIGSKGQKVQNRFRDRLLSYQDALPSNGRPKTSGNIRGGNRRGPQHQAQITAPHQMAFQQDGDSVVMLRGNSTAAIDQNGQQILSHQDDNETTYIQFSHQNKDSLEKIVVRVKPSPRRLHKGSTSPQSSFLSSGKGSRQQVSRLRQKGNHLMQNRRRLEMKVGSLSTQSNRNFRDMIFVSQDRASTDQLQSPLINQTVPNLNYQHQLVNSPLAGSNHDSSSFNMLQRPQAHTSQGHDSISNPLIVIRETDTNFDVNNGSMVDTYMVSTSAKEPFDTWFKRQEQGSRTYKRQQSKSQRQMRLEQKYQQRQALNLTTNVQRKYFYQQKLLQKQLDMQQEREAQILKVLQASNAQVLDYSNPEQLPRQESHGDPNFNIELQDDTAATSPLRVITEDGGSSANMMPLNLAARKSSAIFSGTQNLSELNYPPSLVLNDQLSEVAENQQQIVIKPPDVELKKVQSKATVTGGDRIEKLNLTSCHKMLQYDLNSKRGSIKSQVQQNPRNGKKIERMNSVKHWGKINSIDSNMDLLQLNCAGKDPNVISYRAQAALNKDMKEMREANIKSSQQIRSARQSNPKGGKTNQQASEQCNQVASQTRLVANVDLLGYPLDDQGGQFQAGASPGTIYKSYNNYGKDSLAASIIHDTEAECEDFQKLHALSPTSVSRRGGRLTNNFRFQLRASAKSIKNGGTGSSSLENNNEPQTQKHQATGQGVEVLSQSGVPSTVNSKLRISGNQGLSPVTDNILESKYQEHINRREGSLTGRSGGTNQTKGELMLGLTVKPRQRGTGTQGNSTPVQGTNNVKRNPLIPQRSQIKKIQSNKISAQGSNDGPENGTFTSVLAGELKLIDSNPGRRDTVVGQKQQHQQLLSNQGGIIVRGDSLSLEQLMAVEQNVTPTRAQDKVDQVVQSSTVRNSSDMNAHNSLMLNKKKSTNNRGTDLSKNGNNLTNAHLDLQPLITPLSLVEVSVKKGRLPVSGASPTRKGTGRSNVGPLAPTSPQSSSGVGFPGTKMMDPVSNRSRKRKVAVKAKVPVSLADNQSKLYLRERYDSRANHVLTDEKETMDNGNAVTQSSPRQQLAPQQFYNKRNQLLLQQTATENLTEM